MTITLHWWMVPTAIVLAGFIIAWRHEDRGGYIPDFTDAFSILVTVVGAAAICIGLWL